MICINYLFGLHLPKDDQIDLVNWTDQVHSLILLLSSSSRHTNLEDSKRNNNSSTLSLRL